MSDNLRVGLEQPTSSGLLITLNASGNTLSFVASHIPYDSLAELATVLLSIRLTDTGHRVVRWGTEPVEYEFHFTTDTEAITLTVIQWPGSARQRDHGRAVFTVYGERTKIVRSFWRALRQLESHSATTWEWHYPFPTSDMRKLERCLQQAT